MLYKDIPRMTRDGNYRVNVSWNYIESWIERQQEVNLNLDPDFQRAHVWTEDQQRKYVEFCLRGGVGSNELRFNCAGWMKDYRGPFVLVDGKQRLEAVRKFLRNELIVFDQLCSDFGKQSVMHYNFLVCVNDLDNMKDVLQWYIDINSGGVVHTSEEIEKVKQLMKEL